MNRAPDMWADLGCVARAWRWGRRRQPPTAAPEPAPRRQPTRRVHRPSWSLWVMRQQLILDVSGLDAVAGLAAPVVVAANHQSALDVAVLRAAVPRSWRCVTADPEAALAAGRSVIVFPEGDPSDGQLGAFSTAAAELAANHNVPLVPVAVSGTFKLKALLRLRGLRLRPKVQVRFGSPLAPRTRSITETTDALRTAILDLLESGGLTWWGLQQRAEEQPSAGVESMASWRRMWGQSAPRAQRPKRTRERIWSDPTARRTQRER